MRERFRSEVGWNEGEGRTRRGRGEREKRGGRRGRGRRDEGSWRSNSYIVFCLFINIKIGT
jgi:hypothetical protein